jgi:hypothetical protein
MVTVYHEDGKHIFDDSMQMSFETTDPKLARRCRFAQFRWMKTTLSVDGSPVSGGRSLAKNPPGGGAGRVSPRATR